MTLLAPGAMLLAALLTVPPLVVFYLLKLRRRPLRVTTTMFWEQAARDLQVNVPFRWIRPSWLLVLHALILALLLIALGRPALDHGGSSAGRVFLLIDRSASMSATDAAGGRSRLDRAKGLALDEIEDLTAALDPPEITVIAYGAEPVVVGPPSSSAGTLVAMVESIEPTDQPGDHAAAMALVRSLTAGVPSDNDAGDAALVVLVTDGGGLERLPPSPHPVRVVLAEPMRQGGGPNAGIIAFSAERDTERPEAVRVFVRLLNTAPTPASAPLVASVDGEPVSRTAVTIPAAGAGPGERVETLTFERASGGLLRVALEREDALEADNTVWAVLPPVARPPVLLVVPPARSVEDPIDARGRADPFLLDVLEALGTAGVRVVDLDQYARASEADREQFGVIVFDRASPEVPPRRPTLSFGAAWPALGIDVSDRPSVRTPVLSWDRAHPVMADAVMDTIVIADRLTLPEDDTTLGGAAVGPGSPVDMNADVSRRTLARGRGGPLILELDDAGVPRIVVAFALEQSNWPVHFSFPIFMLAAFDRLAPGATGGVWSDTATPLTVRLDTPLAAAELDGPVRRRVELPDAGSALPLGSLSRVGVYRLRDASGGTVRTVAVNLVSSQESSLRVASDGIDAIGESPRAGIGGEPREVWRLFVLAAGVLLLMEWLLYTARSRA